MIAFVLLATAGSASQTAPLIQPWTIELDSHYFNKTEGIDERVVETLTLTPNQSGGLTVQRKMVKTQYGKVEVPIADKTPPTIFECRLASDGTLRQEFSDAEPPDLVRINRLLFPPGRPGTVDRWEAALPMNTSGSIPAGSFELRVTQVNSDGSWSADLGMTETGTPKPMSAAGSGRFDEKGRWRSMEWKGTGARLPGGDGTPVSFAIKTTANYRP